MIVIDLDGKQHDLKTLPAWAEDMIGELQFELRRVETDIRPILERLEAKNKRYNVHREKAP